GFEPRLGRELDFDPAGGRALLNDAGYSGGLGFPRLAFSFQDTSEERPRVEFMRNAWKQHLDIDIELNPMSKQAFHHAVDSKDFDVALTGWIADYPDPQDWFSGSFSCGGSINTVS